jgi:hypothetical protein
MKTSRLHSQTPRCRVRRVVAGMTTLCLMLALQPAIAAEQGEYPPPKLDNFQAAGESPADVDGDGANESLIKRYISEAGVTIFSLNTGDRLWAWSVANAEGDSLDPSKSYVIRDSNCDGVFDKKYGVQEDFEIPACVK